MKTITIERDETVTITRTITVDVPDDAVVGEISPSGFDAEVEIEGLGWHTDNEEIVRVMDVSNWREVK